MSGTAVLARTDETASKETLASEAMVLSTGGETLAAINIALERCSCLNQWLNDGFADEGEARSFLLDLFYHNEDLFFSARSADSKLRQAYEFVKTGIARWLQVAETGRFIFVFDKGYL